MPEKLSSKKNAKAACFARIAVWQMVFEELSCFLKAGRMALRSFPIIGRRGVECFDPMQVRRLTEVLYLYGHCGASLSFSGSCGPTPGGCQFGLGSDIGRTTYQGL